MKVEHQKNIIFLPLLRKVVNIGKEVNNINYKLGSYRVDHISKDGDVTAGCHQIKYQEIERLAKLLGV